MECNITLSVNRLLHDLLQSIREHIGCLFQLSADIAELDLITSLAQVSSLPAYTRPSFGSKLELIDSRHPVMDVFAFDGPVPNHVVITFTHACVSKHRMYLCHVGNCFSRSCFSRCSTECIDTSEPMYNIWIQHERQIDLSQTNCLAAYNGATWLFRTSQESNVSCNRSHLL